MRKLIPKQSLYANVGISIILVIGIITILSSTYFYLIVKNRVLDDVKNGSSLSIASLKQNVADLVASYSENEYLQLISNEMQQRGYYAIIVEDNNMGKILGQQPYFVGKIRDDKGNMIDFDPDDKDHHNHLGRSFYSQKRNLVSLSGEVVGAISIYVSDQAIKNQLDEVIFFTVANASVISMFLILILYISIRHFVLKPISNICSVMNQTDEDGIPLRCVAENSSKEMSLLGNTINNMVTTIKVSRENLIQNNIKLNESKGLLSIQSAAMRAASDGIVITDVNANIVWVNPAFEKITGYSFEDVHGKNPKILKSGFHKMPFYQDLWATILSGETWYGELKNRRKDGTIYIEEESITPVFNDQGEIINFIAIKRDISLQRERDRELQHAQKMDALGKLTGGVAHDFNNMLGVIIGYAEFLKDSLADNSKLLKYANEIYRAGERGSKLTKKLLSFSRRESSEPGNTNINKLLLDEQHMLEKTLTVSVELILDLAEDLWPVWVDISDLEDVILNMSINAMHAMPEGGKLKMVTTNQPIDESVAAYLGLNPGDYVLLEIIDTGYGMDEEIQQKVFDPFFSTKGEMGTGLGLSQVYSFVQCAKGAIKIYSEPGRGSRFALYFPRYHGHTDLILEGQQADIEKKLVGKEAILVVDDESALLDLVEEFLVRYGYRVFTACDGEQALKVLEVEKVDLLLTDVIMPNMDGSELAERVSKMFPDIKIQLASGFSDKLLHRVSDDLKENILHKPLNLSKLLERVRTLLNSN